MTVGNIVFTKGSNSVEVYVNSVSDEYSNKLITLTLATTETNQSSGAKTTKVVDLLRITRQFIIKAYLTDEDTETAKQIKDRLYLIATGSGEDGGEITMNYDGDDYKGYLEKITCTQEANDHNNMTNKELAKYELTLNFLVGVSATSS